MLTENGTSKTNILIILATETAEMVRLEKIWKYRDIEFNLNYNLYKSLVGPTIHFTICIYAQPWL